MSKDMRGVNDIPPLTRKQLVDATRGAIMADERFRNLRGLTLSQLNDAINMVLDGRNEAIKKWQELRGR